MDKDKIYLGNNLDILKDMPNNSVDSIVTDPPYGLGKEPDVVEVMKDWIEKGYHDIKGKGFMGKEWDAFVPQPILWKECLRVLKPGGHLLSFAGTRTYDWVVMGLRFAGFEIRDQIAWVYGSGFPKSYDVGKAIEGKLTKYTTDLAKIYEGWGTALKPSIEPIVMARKPLEGTVAENVLKYGTGGINIDECRVGTEERFNSPAKAKKHTFNCSFDNDYNGNTVNGRFPANVIHDGSDEVVSIFPDVGGSYRPGNRDSRNAMFDMGEKDKTNQGYNDNGSASRFFYCAKASQSERNMGLYGFEQDTINDGREKSIDNPFQRGKTIKRNIHPTVKPIDLMRYLVRLVTPKGGLVLDPYMGSGTTAIACKKEKMHYIGCELEEEYLEIAKARIKSAIVEYDIFDYL